MALFLSFSLPHSTLRIAFCSRQKKTTYKSNDVLVFPWRPHGEKVPGTQRGNRDPDLHSLAESVKLIKEVKMGVS